MTRIHASRTLHDLGLAAWFGGTLMGAVGLNGAAAAVGDPQDRARVASAGWAKWAPVSAAAIAAHLAGGAVIVNENRGRIAGQKGVAAWTAAKAGLTGVALAATAASGIYGAKVAKAGRVPAEGGTEPSDGTPDDVAQAMKRLKALQWAIPALTGGIVYANAVMGEQQRPAQVIKGTVERLTQAATAVTDRPVALARTISHSLSAAS